MMSIRTPQLGARARSMTTISVLIACLAGCGTTGGSGGAFGGALLGSSCAGLDGVTGCFVTGAVHARAICVEGVWSQLGVCAAGEICQLQGDAGAVCQPLGAAGGADGGASDGAGSPAGDVAGGGDVTVGGDAGDAAAGADSTVDDPMFLDLPEGSCLYDKMCANNRRCDPATHQCVGCLEDGDCLAKGATCVDQFCVGATACTGDAPCKSLDGVCSTVDKFCVACVKAADCGPGFSCVGSRCVGSSASQSCTTSKSCPDNLVCAADKKCHECASNGDCASNAVCLQYQCVTKFDACLPGAKACVGESKASTCVQSTTGSVWSQAKTCSYLCDATGCVVQKLPKLQLNPATVNFGSVVVGTSSCKPATMYNKGNGDLLISALQLSGGGGFRFQGKTADGKDITAKAGSPLTLSPPLTIAPNKTFSYQVCYDAADWKTQTGTLAVVSNDDTAKVTTVSLSANTAQSCLQVEPAGVAFGGVVPGTQSVKALKLKSCSSAPLYIEGVSLAAASSSDYSLSFAKMAAAHPGIDPVTGPTSSKPLMLASNGSAVVDVIYKPSVLSSATGSIQVLSNAAGSPKTAMLSGAGVEAACAQPKIDITEGNAVVPQTLLHLTGAKSTLPSGGSIKKYQWTVQGPQGSYATFVPGAGFPSPVLQPNVVGQYQICLDVTDSFGNAACAPACETVVVVPDNAVYVELLWDTPGDANQADAGPGAGANLDLHFAHSFATGPDLDCDALGDPWFSNPFDAFWFNPNPNWGQSNPNVDDNPSIALDDTDGAGPEILTLNQPEGTAQVPATYRVGVHSWNEHGFGPSTASVRVYLSGALEAAITGVTLKELDMWTVGRLHWPAPAASSVQKAKFEICYQSADPCKGGKRWQPQGAHCITHCYVNPAFTVTGGGNLSKCGKN